MNWLMLKTLNSLEKNLKPTPPKNTFKNLFDSSL